jgi:hypothetical protein
MNSRTECRYYWREYCIPHLDRKSAWSLAEVRVSPPLICLSSLILLQETLLEDHLRNNGETSWETVRELFPTRPYGYLHTKSVTCLVSIVYGLIYCQSIE